MTAPAAVVAHGRSCLVYAHGDAQVRKVYLPTWPQERVATEVRDAQLAYRLGATPIACHGVAEDGSERAVLFDRLDGVALTTAAEQNPLRLPRISRQFAAAHVHLHDVHTREPMDVRDLAIAQLSQPAFSDVSLGERDAIAAHLRKLPDGDSLLHLDFHPQNVFLHDGGTAIIDWQSAAHGDPAADVAMSRLLMSEGELFPGITPVQKAVYGNVRGLMRHYYLREYRARTGMTVAQIDRWDIAARVLRMGLQNLPSEHEGMLAGIRVRLTRR